MSRLIAVALLTVVAMVAVPSFASASTSPDRVYSNLQTLYKEMNAFSKQSARLTSSSTAAQCRAVPSLSRRFHRIESLWRTTRLQMHEVGMTDRKNERQVQSGINGAGKALDMLEMICA